MGWVPGPIPSQEAAAATSPSVLGVAVLEVWVGELDPGSLRDTSPQAQSSGRRRGASAPVELPLSPIPSGVGGGKRAPPQPERWERRSWQGAPGRRPAGNMQMSWAEGAAALNVRKGPGRRLSCAQFALGRVAPPDGPLTWPRAGVGGREEGEDKGRVPDQLGACLLPCSPSTRGEGLCLL